MKKLLSTLKGRRILVCLTLLHPVVLIILGWSLINNAPMFLIIAGTGSLIAVMANKYLYQKTSLWSPGLFEKMNPKNRNLDERQLLANSIAFRYSYLTISTIVLLAVITIMLIPTNSWIGLVANKSNILIISLGLFAFIRMLPSTILAWREKDVEIIN